jgi:integrase/recombinase XerD
MGKKGQHTPAAPIGDPSDGNTLYNWMRRFLAHQLERHYSPHTVANRETYLRYFIAWADERGLHYPQEITKPILEAYQRHLFHHRKLDGQPLSVRSQHGRIIPIRALFSWLVKNNHLLSNPASDLELPRLDKRLPRAILTQSEVEAVLNGINTTTPMGIRDRAIIEVLYSTGMRRMEVIGLRWDDIDTERGTLFIREGKGRVDRMVPIGERALAWCEKYLHGVRAEFDMTGHDPAFFLTSLGEAFTPNRMTQLVRNHIVAAEIGKSGSCHLFRHSCATLMLENGADIRFIQQLLGHAKLDTTQIYTQVSIRQLKQVHTLTHPAKMGRGGTGEDVVEDGS